MSESKGVFYRHAVESVFDRVVRVRHLDSAELRAALSAIGFELGVLAAWSVVGFAVAIRVFRWQ